MSTWTYGEALAWLRSLPDFERTGEFSERPDVEPVLALLAALGDPHRARPTVHLAGSKGKGSTGAMVESLLRAAGLRTGYYISPHLHRWRERIRLGGEPATEEAFASALASVRDALPGVAERFPGRHFIAFDALTMAAFVAFRDASADAQVVEVGLGGRLDSTNVFHEAAHVAHVAVITPISLEHTDILGTTIPQIAREKAGIITPGCTVVVSPQRESALDVIRAVAAERGAAVVEVAASCQVSRTSASAGEQKFKLKTPRGTYDVTLPLAGRHQLENAAAAVVACEAFAGRAGMELTPVHVREGLGRVRWPARLEVLQRRPLVVIDGAHNGDSAKRMAAALRDDFGLASATFVFGSLAGKDVGGMAAAVAPVAAAVYATGWPSERAADPRELAAAFAGLDVPVFTFGDPVQAYEAAVAAAGESGAVVAFGALSFVALVRAYVLGIESDMIRMMSRAPREAARGEGPARATE
ncbi:MAG TPA: folylpolyglutamate synthase/dihydrofolate synthase family protein [Dehalococcoidia bacterium]|nr:folylpolyglutamate synthase/dihydrofolate synthase family protein [Dehalococcoidia bacterium]